MSMPTSMQSRMAKLTGNILAGGQSRRMGTPKAWIPYHGLPEVIRLNELLSHFCEKTVISINDWPENAPRLMHFPDAPEYADSGPIGGVLTAYTRFKSPLLVLGCDYPMITHDLIQTLISARDESKMATAFLNDAKVAEPLIAIYETSGLEQLKQDYQSGHQSIKHFLHQADCKLLPAPIEIKSIDTPNDRDSWLNHSA